MENTEFKQTLVCMTTYNTDGTTTDWIPKPDLSPCDAVTAAEFKILGQKVFGKGREYGWKTYMSNITGTPVSTINQWAGGNNRVPPIVGWILRTLERLV